MAVLPPGPILPGSSKHDSDLVLKRVDTDLKLKEGEHLDH